MNKSLLIILVISGLLLHQCRVIRDIQKPGNPELKGKEAMVQKCTAIDTIQSFLISKAEAILLFDNERYEVSYSSQI